MFVVGQQQTEYYSLDLRERVAIFVAKLAVQPQCKGGCVGSGNLAGGADCAAVFGG